MNDNTIPPVNRKSHPVRARMTAHVAAKNGGWKAWVAAIVGGVLIMAIGAAFLIFLATVPWWVGVLIIVGGLQVASRGAFVAGLAGLKDAIIEILRARKESA